MTVIDWLIVIVFAFFVFMGFRKGFVQQLFDLLGSVFALVLAFYLYQRAGAYLAKTIQVSIPLANIIGFILIVVGISGCVSFLGRRWHGTHKNEPVALIDGGVGALFGGLKAAVILIIILLVVMAMPWDFIHHPVEVSGFANDLLRLAPMFYVLQDTSLPADLPRLVVSPEGIQLRALSNQALQGATCFICGAKVEYKGLVKQGLTVYPQTYCPKCHYTSDGCLTFEGYHMLHNAVPMNG